MHIKKNMEIQEYKNIKITEYVEFINVLEKVGFMPLSNNCIDFINLSALTDEKAWHTDLPTDPWSWRVKAEEEGKAAYGKLFDKKPSFIAMEWYPLFIAARRKGKSFEEAYAEGVYSNYAKQIYDLFKGNKILAVHEIKLLAGFNKETNSKYEAAMTELQMGMFITINGTKQKVSQKGETYGWPSTAYSTVENWAGEELMEMSQEINEQEAVDRIMDRVREISPQADQKKIKKFLAL
jgi:hypothetical protein